jgi:hypothetical protein
MTTPVTTPMPKAIPEDPGPEREPLQIHRPSGANPGGVQEDRKARNAPIENAGRRMFDSSA